VAGQLIKVSKDKDGVITRDVLTKKMDRLVGDYWAVDFDYESGKKSSKCHAHGRRGRVARSSRLTRASSWISRSAGPALTFSRTSGKSFRTRQDRDLE